ncbi:MULTISPECIES: AfsR/SARP family transcriptional regulator [Frankia]|uniref:AfsR/SARP family transcriptional regulator n=1 Tax=Frankia TaxID=1854 RepID=UPI0003080C67|nr:MULTISPECIES: AfsR/SARP family transcriptional regulator [Frankia]
MEATRYELLGPLQIRNEKPVRISAPKVEILLAALLIRANRPVSAEELISEIWGDDRPSRVRAGLHVYISQLRKICIGPEGHGAVITTHAHGYVLRVDDSLTDVHDLQQLHARGRADQADQPERAFVSFTAAAALFRGPVLAGIRDGDIVSTFIRWAEEMRLECLESIARCSLRTGRHRELVCDLTNWIDEHPFHEAFRELLMLALHLSGRRAEALREFQCARRLMREELGLEPSETMRQLQNAILNDRRDLVVAG